VRRQRWLVVLAGAALSVSSCTWQAYAVTRGLRHLTGVQTRLHALTPIRSSLKAYRVIQVEPLHNLAPGRMPPDLEEYVNDRLVKDLRSIASSPTVVRLDGSVGSEDASTTVPAGNTLRCVGFIDDYDPGYLSLRLVELGFNHVAITVRIELRDSTSGRVVGAASVTSQDDRVTATSRAAVDRLARRFSRFVNSGYVG
jgi:hypothetical protein